MKKYFSLIALMCCIYSVLSAQESFVVKASGPNELNLPVDMVITPDDNIFFLFSSMPTNSSTVYTNKIVELNPSGEIVNTFTYADTAHDYVRYYYSLLEDDTLYVFGFGYRPIGQNTLQIFLLTQTFDLQLNLIITNRVYLEQLYPNSALNGRIKYIDGNFHCISCFSGSNIGFRAFHAEVSKQGEIINFNIAGEIGKTLVPTDFIRDSCGGFQVYSGSAGYVAPYIMSGLLTKHNKDFQIESFSPLPSNFYNFYTREAANDSIFYLAGEWFDLNSAIFWRAGLLKMENDTTVLDEFLYTTYPDSATCPAYFNSIEILPDGNIIFCFTSNVLNNFYPQDQAAQINLMKLTPDLEVIWHRYIGEPDTKYDAYTMRTTDLDEIVILGAYSHAPPGNTFEMQALFIKTNSEGIITGTNDGPSGVRSTEAIVYPNPARDFVQIEFSMAYTQATFSLLDISGKTVFEKQLTTNKQSLDVSGIPAGSYIYRIFNNNGLNEKGKLLVE